MGVINFLKSIDRAMGGTWIASGLGAVLVFMLLGFFSSKIFHSGGHSEDEPLAFALEIEDDAPVEEEPEIDLASLAMSADLAAGEKVFSKCKACHKMADGENGVGPHLWGIVGRDIAAVDGYAYGDYLASAGGAWDLEALNGFLENPKGWAPGTKMSFAGLKKPEDRVNLIAWMNEADGTPIELAAAPAETADDATDAVEEDAVEEPVTEEEAAPEETSEEAAAASDDTAAEAVTDAADSTAAAVEETVETVAEDVTAASEETAETVTEAVEDTATAVSDAASDTAAAATEDAAEAADATTESVGDLAAAAADAVEETAPAAATGPYAALLAAADAGAGKKVFRKCRACHKLEDGKNGVGPHLWGVVGRDQGSVEGYNYSDALKGLGGSWTLAELDAFLEKPKSYAPGTKMAFGGLKKPEDRINLIVYLNEEDGSPEPLE